MLDLLSYIFGPLIFLTNHNQYSKTFKKVLFLMCLWIINAIVSDIWRDTPFDVAFKAEMEKIREQTQNIE